MSSNSNFLSIFRPKFRNPFTKKAPRKSQRIENLRPMDDVMYERLKAKEDKRAEQNSNWIKQEKMTTIKEAEMNARLAKLKGPTTTMSDLEERLAKLKKGGTKKKKKRRKNTRNRK